MFTRPVSSAAVGIVAAATILVGGASLASDAAPGHGHAGGGAARAHGAAPPKTISFTLGQLNTQYPGGVAKFFTAKVPKGSYSVSLNGGILDSTPTGDGIVCAIADKKALVHILLHPTAGETFNRIYELVIQSESDSSSSFGFFEGADPLVKINRPTIAYGCILEGSGPFRIVRVPVFTLTPVKNAPHKSKPLPLSKADPRALLRASR
jgi:hypothetical protein